MLQSLLEIDCISIPVFDVNDMLRLLIWITNGGHSNLNSARNKKVEKSASRKPGTESKFRIVIAPVDRYRCD